MRAGGGGRDEGGGEEEAYHNGGDGGAAMGATAWRRARESVCAEESEQCGQGEEDRVH